ncbi:MAG TPA: 4Fe-4S binding protein [Anaerolineales bacterium]
MNSELVTPEPREPRKRKARRTLDMGPWVRARKTVQVVALLTFALLFLWSRQSGWPGGVVNLPMRLDPLLVLMQSIASRTLLAGSALALLVLVGTLVFGRFWCGWLCPLGTTLDLVAPRSRSRQQPRIPDRWRSLKYVLLLTTLAAALFGNLTLLFLDPLTIFQRTLTVGVWPALNQAVTAAEAVLFQVPALADPVSLLDSWLRPVVLPINPAYYRDALLFASLFLAVVLLDLLAPRFWCRYLCPLGALLGLLSKPALFQRRLKQECKGCTLCTELCPTGTVDPGKGYASDPGECTMCMECLATCPRGLATFAPQVSMAKWNDYDPSRRDALLALGTGVAAVALFRSDALVARPSPTLLRPPGVPDLNPDLVAFTRCTRCSECMRVCPTGGLQPAVGEAGIAGFGSPLLVPRLGYCDYSCNACGQVCPVQAIPPLTVAEKRTQVIGVAYIDENRCIAWSDHTPCIVCQEMCPLPNKAVWLEDALVLNPDGTQVSLQLPHVLRDVCIGCGICEYKCPVNGQAAIRVYNTRGGAQV